MDQCWLWTASCSLLTLPLLPKLLGQSGAAGCWQANTFIFPCIGVTTLGYKIAQRLGGYAAPTAPSCRA